MLKINLKQFGIDIRNFTKGEKIGKGGYSDVFLVQYKKTGENYAAKILKTNVYKEDEKRKIENEIEIMSNISHPAIVKFLGYSLLDFNLITNIVIFTEYEKNGSLSKIISKAKKSETPTGYDNTTRQIILIGVAYGMRYLHHQNIMHRDLNTNNVLLDDQYYPHITDFGMAKYLHKIDLFEETPIIGTLPYMAPEMILGNKYTYKIDVYSYGIVMYEVICESDLYPHMSDKISITTNDSITNEYRKYIAISNNRPEFTKEIKNSLKNLIENCWSSDIKERPTFDEIYEKLISPEYYLDDVDEKRIKKYINYITKNEKVKNNSKNSELIEKVNNLSKENKELKEQIKSLKVDNEKLSTCCNQLKQMLDEMAKKVENESTVLIQPPISKSDILITKSPRSLIKDRKENGSLMKIINEEKPKFSTPQKEMKNEVKKEIKNEVIKGIALKSPIIIVKQNDADDNEIINIHQKEKKTNEVEIIQKSPIKFNQQKEKINGQLLVPTTPRRIHQFINKDDEINIKTKGKLPLLHKQKPTENFIINSEMTVSEFNSISLKQQQQIINSKVISMNSILPFFKPKNNEYISNLQKLLNFFIQFITSPDESNFIEIQTENKREKLDDINGSTPLIILSKTTEILYDSKLLDSPEFYKLTKLFKCISIEIKYVSKNFQSIYKIVFPLNHLKMNVFISGIKKTDDTFKGNKYILSVKFDDSVSIIGDYAFANCYSIKQVIIPSSVTSIGYGSFEGCYSLKSISIPSSVTSIGLCCFKNCSDLKDVSMCNSIKLLKNNTFYGCKRLRKFSIPNSVSSIGDSCFYDCVSLLSISIPSSVISIGEFAFGGCSTLKQISIPFSVNSIGKGAFKGCKNLEIINIPSSIKNLNELGINDKCKVLKF